RTKLSQSEYRSGKMPRPRISTTDGATISQPWRRWRAARVPPREVVAAAMLVGVVEALTGHASGAAGATCAGRRFYNGARLARPASAAGGAPDRTRDSEPGCAYRSW